MTLQDFSLQDQQYLLRKCLDYYSIREGDTVTFDGTKEHLMRIARTLDTAEVREVVQALATSYIELDLQQVQYIHLERCGVCVIRIANAAVKNSGCLVIDLYELRQQARQLRFLTRFSRVLFAAAVVAMGTAITLVTV